MTSFVTGIEKYYSVLIESFSGQSSNSDKQIKKKNHQKKFRKHTLLLQKDCKKNNNK